MGGVFQTSSQPPDFVLKSNAVTQQKFPSDAIPSFFNDSVIQHPIPYEAEIRAALNQETKIPFQEYAKSLHPLKPAKQARLIKKLQQQDFRHYLHYTHTALVQHQTAQSEQLRELLAEDATTGLELSWTRDFLTEKPPIIPPKWWTRPNIQQFKDNIMRSNPECCMNIGCMEVAKVRIPTRRGTKGILWEFATDDYDLGFRLSFQWDLNPGEAITVSCSHGEVDSSDDEYSYRLDTNRSSGETSLRNMSTATHGDQRTPRTQRTSGHQVHSDDIIPTFRRNCHQAVFCGTHRYIGQGAYIITFDNSYSVWKSKWLYYKIYYVK